MSKIEQAIEKIKNEMHKESNSYTQAIGNFLIGTIGTDDAIAEKVLTEGKTIMGSFKSMENEAKKKKVGNSAVLTDEEGFSIVLKYYEITPGAKKENFSSNKVISINEYKKESKELDIDLDNLLDDL